ncbi:helix-turn-helix transcriptional regulator [Paenibacillus turicensis]|uniref:helix-turn-helix transcriptional regulator n=1 Tax=Paenibacillus turicensis TaxID=160487 RepID=UPI003D27BB9C
MVTPQQSSYQYREDILKQIKKHIPFDAYCFSLIDPYRLLSSGAVTHEGIELIHDSLFSNEYQVNDYNQFIDLMMENRPVASLYETTHGQPEVSERYRTILEPAGFIDELRVVFMDEGKCWGQLALFRSKTQVHFKPDEIKWLYSILSSTTASLKQFYLQGVEKDWSHAPSETGIMMLSEQLELIGANETALELLEQLRAEEQIVGPTLPRSIRVLCKSSHGEEKANSPSRSNLLVYVPTGFYVSIEANALLNYEGKLQFAISFQKATANDLIPLLSDAYHLSLREREVLTHILRGSSTKEISQALYISPYTVQDHLKSIFTKTKVTTRRELIWKFLSQFNFSSSLQ